MTRYHSLVVETDSLPEDFKLTSRTEKEGRMDEIMGIRHRTLLLDGVQFHPESIFSENGYQLLKNFLNGLRVR